MTPDPNPIEQPPPTTPFPEVDPSAVPQEAPQPEPAPGEADTGRPHDQSLS